MLYISPEHRRRMLIIGFIGAVLFAIGDVLLQSFTEEGEVILLFMNTSIRDLPISWLYFTLVSGIIATVMLYVGLSAMDSFLSDQLKQRTTGKEHKMYFVFRLAAIIASLSFFAAHSVCAVLEMSAKQALIYGMDAKTIEAAFKTPFLVSFVATNIWVTFTEVCLSITFIYFVLKRVIPLPVWACGMNTAGCYIVFHVIGALLTRVTGSGIFATLSSAGASFGIGAMFLAVVHACQSRFE